MVEISVSENHRNSCGALKKSFLGWYAYVEFTSGKTVQGIIGISKKGILKIGGKNISKKVLIKYYKPIKI